VFDVAALRTHSIGCTVLRFAKKPSFSQCLSFFFIDPYTVDETFRFIPSQGFSVRMRCICFTFNTSVYFMVKGTLSGIKFNVEITTQCNQEVSNIFIIVCVLSFVHRL